jgi:endonuclease/exonuclease/phosphatase family metal-dependent hydrolase
MHYVRAGVRSGLVLSLAAASVAICPRSAAAQVRILNWNTLDGPTTATDVNFRAVFQAIGADSVNGIAKPVDVLALQEQTDVSGPAIAAMLNALYGVNTYVSLLPAANQTTTDKLGIVYNSATVQLVQPADTVVIGPLRPTARAKFRPVGYTSEAASFWVYSSHLKAGSLETAQRNTEAQGLRNSVNALPAGTNVIATGDYNVYGASEPAYQTLVTNGPLRDPLNRPGEWHSDSTFAALHTQSTRGTDGGMDDRFDHQMVTPGILDGEGFSYIGPTSPGTAGAHSYRAFGNNGTCFNGSVNKSTNTAQPRAVLDALFNASDHVPVVADYQLPAKMQVTYDATRRRALPGGTLSIPYTIANVAPVATALGADELDYTVTPTGAATGAASGGTVAALASAQGALSVNTATPGAFVAGASVLATSEAAADASAQIAVQVVVLRPASPRVPVLPRGGQFVGGDVVLDLGDVPASWSPLALSVPVTAAGDPADTAGLELLAADVTGAPADALALDTSTLAFLAAGDSGTLGLSLLPFVPGPIDARVRLTFLDEDLPGTRGTHTLDVLLRGTVVPEPTAAAALLLFAAGGMRHRRRQLCATGRS